MSARRPDDVLRAWLSLMVLGAVLAGWVGGVAVLYDVPRHAFVQGLWFALKATPVTPALWIGPALGLLLGIGAYAVAFQRYRNAFGGAQFVRQLRGPKLVSPTLLTAKTRERGQQLRFGGIAVPSEVEGTQFFVGGSTGVGKSVCIAEYIESAQARGDRVICVDPDGGFLRYFYQQGDVILNPFDKRGQGWTIFNEIRTGFDCEQYAISMIPRSPSTEQETWNAMGRTIVSEMLAVLLKQGQGSTDKLVYWLTTATNEELRAALAGTPAAGCFHGAEETLASIRTVLTQYITPHKYLSPGSFSFRDHLEKRAGNVWITWRQDMLQALKPLISCWVDVTCASILSMPEDRARRIHLVTDELDSLEKLNYMVDAATKGRKKGLRIVAGVQSLAQLDKTYGPKDALTLRNSFRSAFLCGIGELDTYTAEEFSRGIGEHTVVRRTQSSTAGSRGGRMSVGHRNDAERLVSAGEFHGLANLTGYLKFAGDYPLAKVTLRYKARPIVMAPIVMADEFLARPQEENRLFVA